MPSIQREFISTRGILFSIVLVYLAVYFPILITREDLWDGSIISFAWASQDKAIFSTWFDESGWPLVRWLYEIIYEFCATLGLNFKLVVNFLTVAFVAGSAYEIYRLSRSVYKFDETSSLFGVLFFILMPFASLYFSSAFIQLVLFIYLCLVGTRLYLENKMIPLAMILIAISFQHNSNPCLLFALIVLAYVFGGRRKIKKDFIVLSLLACWYLAFKYMYQPNGLYTGYNKINIGNAFKPVLYFIYLKFFVMIYAALFFAALVLMFKQLRTIKHCALFLCLTMLTIFPYILVGKYFQIWKMDHIAWWDYRFTINSAPILALSFVFILHFVRGSNLSTIWRGTVYLFLSLAVITNLVFLLNSFKMRANDIIYQNSFVEFFKTEKDKFKIGSIEIVDKYNFYHELTNYETNYALYTAFGEKRLEFYPGMTGYKTPAKYQAKYMLLATKPQCAYVISLSGNFDNFSVFERLAYLYSKSSILLKDLHFQAEVTSEKCEQNYGN